MQLWIRNFFSIEYEHDLTDEEVKNILVAIDRFGFPLADIIAFENTHSSESRISELKIAKLWMKISGPTKEISQAIRIGRIQSEGVSFFAAQHTSIIGYTFLLKYFAFCDDQKFRTAVAELGQRGNLEATSALFLFFLGNSEYEVGRRLTNDYSLSNRYILKSRKHIKEALDYKFFSNPQRQKERSQGHGKIGCACYFLASKLNGDDPQKWELLNEAKTELEIAEWEGDTSARHYEYLGEVLIQLANETSPPNVGLLSRGLEALQSAERGFRERGNTTSELVTKLALAHLKAGWARIYDRNKVIAAEHIKTSISLYEGVLSNSKEALAYSKNAVYGRLGQAFYGLSVLEPTVEHIDNAIWYLKEAVSTNVQWLHYLILCHINRHRLNNDIEDLRNADQFWSILPSEQRSLPQSRKLGARLHLLWCSYLKSSGELDELMHRAKEAIDILSTLSPEEEPEAPYYLGNAYGHYGTSVADESEAISNLRQAVSLLNTYKPNSRIASDPLDQAEQFNSLKVPTLALKLALLLEGRKESRDERVKLFELASQHIEDFLKNDSLIDGEKAKLFSLEANTLFGLWRAGGGEEFLWQALDYNQKAMSVSSALTDDYVFLGISGNMHLTAVERLLLRLDEQETNAQEVIRDLLTRAEELFKRSFALQSPPKGSEPYSVYHSRFGQLNYYRYLIEESRQTLENAKNAYEESIASGNNHPDTIGHLGDIYLQRYRFSRASEDLDRAIYLKQSARSLGHISRENWSVTANLLRMKYELQQDPTVITNAIIAALEAWRCDPQWPWPLCQITELIELSNPQHHSPIKEGVSAVLSWPNARLIEQVREILLDDEMNSQSLGMLAAELGREWLVSQPQGRRQLGGVSRAFILSDPYGLLNQVFVYKDSLQANDATKRRTELRRIYELRPLFRKHFDYSEVRLPDPVGILTLDDGNVSLVLRYERGEKLADRIYRLNPRLGIPNQLRDRLLKALAYYHSLPITKGRDSNRVFDHEIAKRLSLGQRLNRFQLSTLADLLSNLKDLIRPKLLNLPKVLKKDAHAENWLVDRSNTVTLLDIESETPRFLYHDLAQMIEGYPLFAANEEGWEQRREWIRIYDYERAIFTGITTEEGSRYEHLYPLMAACEIIIDLIFCWRQMVEKYDAQSQIFSFREPPTSTAASRSEFRSVNLLTKLRTVSNWLRWANYPEAEDVTWQLIAEETHKADTIIRSAIS